MLWIPPRTWSGNGLNCFAEVLSHPHHRQSTQYPKTHKGWCECEWWESMKLPRRTSRLSWCKKCAPFQSQMTGSTMSPQRPSAELTLGPLRNISPTTFIVCLGNTQREVLKADHPVGYSDFHFHHMSGLLSTPAGVCLPISIPDPFPLSLS